MSEFWESLFKNEGALWKSEPSDSAILALQIFKDLGFKNILIPGIGYGRNARLFYEAGFTITGIEISGSAIEHARQSGLDCTIHHGSVTSMPFDDDMYDGIFCYALVHLLSRPQRRKFIASCYNQLKPGGLMIFTVTSKEMDLYGTGRKLSSDRYEISNGLKVYFYDSESVTREFSEFGLVECRDILEPVKYMEGYEPIRMKLITSKKM